MPTQVIATAPASPQPPYEFINSKTLAQRWCLPESWIREQVRSRTIDPIPHIRFGKYIRFMWGSPELEDWARRRMFRPNKRNGKPPETIQ